MEGEEYSKIISPLNGKLVAAANLFRQETIALTDNLKSDIEKVKSDPLVQPTDDFMNKALLLTVLTDKNDILYKTVTGIALNSDPHFKKLSDIVMQWNITQLESVKPTASSILSFCKQL